MISQINKSSYTLEKALDYLWVKNEMISQNIANVNTPGYKRYDVKFDDYFVKEKTKLGSIVKDAKFLPIGADRRILVAPLVIKDNAASMRKDGNNVDINLENAELAKNSINYNVIAGQLSKELSIIKQAIGEGRR